MCLLYITITALFKEGAVEPYFWAIQCFSILIMWFKIIYYMTAHPSVSWLFNMIKDAIREIKEFMYVFIITMFAFASAFYLH